MDRRTAVARHRATVQITARDPEALATRYRAGRTLRQIGAEIGLSHNTVRYHLRKLKRYRSMVTRVLLARVRAAERAYAITRARAKARRLKHALAMLRQKRPAIYARRIERGRPTRCRECSRPVEARPLADLWHWRCDYCGESAIVRRQGIAALLNDPGPMARLRAVQVALAGKASR